MPEHTLGSYHIAAIEGADFVEPDLVLTKDLVLVCFHELVLREGTNIAEIKSLDYLRKNYTGVVGGSMLKIEDDWFIPDLTFTQLRMLRVKQAKVGVRPQYFNKIFQIPTFQEYLELMHELSFKIGRSIGKSIQTKVRCH
jgi:glycerophosphoryl diester phosphodiesterase